MNDTTFLVLSKSGVEAMRKTKPDLKSGQRGVRLNVSMPDAYFDQPFPTVDVTFDEEDVIEPSASVKVEEYSNQLRQYLLTLVCSFEDDEFEEIRYRLEHTASDSLGAFRYVWSLRDKEWRTVPKEELTLQETATLIDHLEDYREKH